MSPDGCPGGTAVGIRLRSEAEKMTAKTQNLIAAGERRKAELIEMAGGC